MMDEGTGGGRNLDKLLQSAQRGLSFVDMVMDMPVNPQYISDAVATQEDSDNGDPFVSDGEDRDPHEDPPELENFDVLEEDIPVVGNDKGLEVNYVPCPSSSVRATTRTVQNSILDDVLAGTQESTGTPFPEVYQSFPDYFDVDSDGGSCGTNSSGSEWLGDLLDFVDSDVETVDLGDPECEQDLGGLDGMDTNSYHLHPLTEKEFASFYADARWSSDSLQLDVDASKFTGPLPGANTP